MPRRKAGSLLPIETEILETVLSMRHVGQDSFHGFGLASTMRERRGSRRLTAHGTLYKALGRLEASGLLSSQWESEPAIEGRPRRRLYALTGEGQRVAETIRSSAVTPIHRRAAAEPA